MIAITKPVPALAAVVAVFVAVGNCNGEAPRDGTDAAILTHVGHWEAIRGQVRPGNGLQEIVPVMAGKRAVLIAGVDYEQASVKAFLFDPATRRWSRAAPSRLWWRFGISAVAAGNRVIVWGGCCGGGGRGSRAPGAIYDAARDRWVPRFGPFGDRYNHTAVWTGKEMIIWGGVESATGSGREQPQADGAAYDPDGDRWRRIAPAPLSPRERHIAVWTGKEMIVWGGSRPGRNHLLMDGAAYDPKRDRWRSLAIAMPLSPRAKRATDDGADLAAAWTGRAMIVWSSNPYAAAGALYEPGRDRWERIPAPLSELRAARLNATAIWTGEDLLLWGGTGDTGDTFVTEGAAYQPDTRRWTALPEPPIAGRDRHVAIWTGEGMLVWGGCCDWKGYYADGAIYVPD